MKPCSDIGTIVNAYNSTLAGAVLLFAALFGENWYLFAALLLFNTLDWLTGWYKARRLRQESSRVGLAGLIKKLLYWVLLAVAFTVAAVLGTLGHDVLGVDLSFLNLLGWFVLASLTVNEARSIVENLVAVGVAVPAVLSGGLAIAAELIDQNGLDRNGQAEQPPQQNQ